MAWEITLSQGFADRINDIEPFRVVEILDRARELQAQGRDIIHLEVGEPDFATLRPIIEAGRQALDREQTYYSAALGLPALRQAIANFYRQQHQVDIDPRRIVITPGASGALLLVAALLINPGEGLLMTDPGYPCNRHFLRLVEGHGQLVPVTAEDCYQLSAERARQAWQANTRGIMVASPANPSGEVLDAQALQGLAALCAEKQAHLIVDEIYHGLCYDGQAPSVLEITDQAFVINSFSKYFGMTGWRLGWLVAPEAAIEPLERLAQNLFISMSTMAQHAALVAFEPEVRKQLDQRRDEFARRRDFLLPALRELGFSIPHCPAGAFYLYAGINGLADDAELFCRDLLEQQGVAITPGTDFGRYQAQQHVRFAYTTGIDRLRVAVERLAQSLS